MLFTDNFNTFRMINIIALGFFTSFVGLDRKIIVVFKGKGKKVDRCIF